MRLVRLGAVGALAAALAGCAGHPWWYQSGDSSCGTTYMLRVHGHVASYGGCVGVLVEPPPTLRLRVGEHFDIHVDDPPPAVSTPGVLRRTALSYNSNLGYSTLTFDAIKPGSTELTYHTYCRIKPTLRQRTGTCALLRIVVTAQ